MIFGIDPGITGAVAWFDGEYHVEDFPLHEQIVNKKKKNYICSICLGELLRYIEPDLLETAYVEKVSAQPSQGVTSMFNFGRSLGIVEGVLGGYGLHLEYVTPQKWKKYHGLIGTEKDAARLLALEKWPELKDELRLKKHSGRADALLILDYGINNERRH